MGWWGLLGVGVEEGLIWFPLAISILEEDDGRSVSYEWRWNESPTKAACQSDLFWWRKWSKSVVEIRRSKKKGGKNPVEIGPSFPWHILLHLGLEHYVVRLNILTSYKDADLRVTGIYCQEKRGYAASQQLWFLIGINVWPPFYLLIFVWERQTTPMQITKSFKDGEIDKIIEDPNTDDKCSREGKWQFGYQRFTVGNLICHLEVPKPGDSTQALTN